MYESYTVYLSLKVSKVPVFVLDVLDGKIVN
jgi:hypothetical protein